DYVYHGRTEFQGIHTKDTLGLSASQRKQFTYQKVEQLFPEYYVLRVNEFDKHALTPLDEWISFLKTGKIPARPQAKGLKEAKEILDVSHLSDKDRLRYNSHMEALRYQASVIETGRIEGREEGIKEGMEKGIEKGLEKGIEKGREEAQKTMARNLKVANIPIETIISVTGLTEEQINEL
ncbi:hypothetical protein D0T85_21955, partial [Bacteroides sp. 519]|nr:hypothetical protein [Bacteroides sp. 519]